MNYHEKNEELRHKAKCSPLFSRPEGKKKCIDRAFEYSDQNGGCPIFTIPNNFKGYSYQSQGWETFFDSYMRMNPEQRKYNELIREEDPVKFYIDAELHRPENSDIIWKGKKEEELMEETRNLCIDSILRCFPHVKRDTITMIELDASNDEKLSRHIIFKIAGKALENNYVAGLVYKDILRNTKDDSLLWIMKKDHKNTIRREHFIDGGVYNKNKTMRVYQSTKNGEYRFLHFPGIDTHGDVPDLERLKDSLITYFPAFSLKSMVLLNLGEKRKRSINMNVDRPEKKICISNQISDLKSKPKKWSTDHLLFEKMKNMFSFPIFGGGLDEESLSITYWEKNKDCEIYGSHHKSNHITWVVDLMNKTYKQGCLDPDCRGKFGKNKNIPEEYHEDIKKFIEEDIYKTNFASIFDYDSDRNVDEVKEIKKET